MDSLNDSKHLLTFDMTKETTMRPERNREEGLDALQYA
jgi:hypothetical protein